jgi:TrmH family RNA methyltransferase
LSAGRSHDAIHSGVAPLGASNPEVRELRRLLRSRRARDDSARFVIEGPRVLQAALDHDVELEAVYTASRDGDRDVVARCAARGVAVRILATGVAERLGDTVTPQGLFARAVLRRTSRDGFLRAALDGALDSALDRGRFVVVADRISDPGNAGTLVRSAAAAGAAGISLGAGSVDAYNPKVVRASAGALFAVPIVEGSPTVEILERLGSGGMRRVGAVARGGRPLDELDLGGPVALVVGHEVHGMGDLPLDELVTIPMAAGTESLNVAMAATVLCFEAQRRRRVAGR